MLICLCNYYSVGLEVSPTPTSRGQAAGSRRVLTIFRERLRARARYRKDGHGDGNVYVHENTHPPH